MLSANHPRFNPLSVPALLAAAFIAGGVLVSGCAQTAGLLPSKSTDSTTGDKKKQLSSQFADLPIPKGAKMNVDKTVVVGGRTWYGQLNLDTSHSANTMFEFYERELANYGWRKITSVRAATSILSYDRQNRVLTIAIQPNRLRGSDITITVSPMEKTAAPAPAISPYPAAPGVLRPPAPGR